MDTILTIISMGLVITALVLCICTWRALRSVSKPHPRAGYKHSALERRRKSLELATKEWNRKLSRGHIFLAGEQKHLVDQLEREVAALENDLFGTKGECRKHVTTISRGHDELHRACYIAQCYLCDWYSVGFLRKKVEAEGAAHEGTHV